MKELLRECVLSVEDEPTGGDEVKLVLIIFIIWVVINLSSYYIFGRSKNIDIKFKKMKKLLENSEEGDLFFLGIRPYIICALDKKEGTLSIESLDAKQAVKLLLGMKKLQ